MYTDGEGKFQSDKLLNRSKYKTYSSLDSGNPDATMDIESGRGKLECSQTQQKEPHMGETSGQIEAELNVEQKQKLEGKDLAQEELEQESEGKSVQKEPQVGSLVELIPDHEPQVERVQKELEPYPKVTILKQDSQAEPEVQSVPAQETQAEPEVQSVSGQESEAEPGVQSVPAQETQAEPEVQSVPVQEPEAEPEVTSVPAQEPEAEPEVQSVPAYKTQAEPEVASVPAQETQAEPEVTSVP